MRLNTRQPLSWLLAVKLSAWCVVAGAAAPAAAQAVADASPADITLLTWFFIILFSHLGWAVGYLDTLAEWFAPVNPNDPDGERHRWADRLKLVVKPYLAANAAGIVFYMLAEAAPGWFGFKGEVPDMVEFVGVFAAGMGGLKTLDWVRARFFGAPIEQRGM